MKKLMHAVAGFSVVALFTLAQPAYSKTPDGKTPAEESVCDTLQDATPGLYGLCVAFCEAHDADSRAPGGDPEALRRPDRKLLENYDRKRREGDPPMPCLLQPPADDGPTGNEPPTGFCPCWTAVQLEEMMPPINNTDLPVPGACASGTSGMYLFNHENGPDGPRFELKHYRTEGCDVVKENYTLGAPAGTLYEMTVEESEACAALLVNHARKYSTPGVWDCFSGP
ncbi:MAG: hypothetical protein OEW35_06475 [Gammaproteobacteria bacterium]|nr:hypothetical protein [Gammaproteobacteria bacterium]MDH4253537.1 hypothetical protein [Gammaproteobacteria bacterium]